MIVLPEDWPYRCPSRPHAEVGRIMQIRAWLAEHVGQHGQDWHMSFGFWLFRRQDHHALFLLTWG